MMSNLLRVLTNVQSRHLSTTRLLLKKGIDYSKVPTLDEDDLEEQFVRGSGPGGQSVNKTNNCVVIKHKPTGIVSKCHDSRSQSENRKLARQKLITQLDNLLNKEMSIEAQTSRLLKSKAIKEDKKKEKLRLLKAQWKEREGIT
ncbi:probable peptide chain release factor C12orf65, mitochondrial [Nilaparvata lugens]|uniref:probable peptide chain release factor C12orf65, mitochondrial n=1 Tax=Nilaparvata lugens TaxID=108931 RepID=UPI00193D5F56|nr:probable peptide chain release factor C12orf65, mitochondrial [Nilaparvata lugens]XP_039281771.1 probable peptide chain release factor C12orf65, mitochondrial [Nilaparvata lugens]